MRRLAAVLCALLVAALVSGIVAGTSARDAAPAAGAPAAVDAGAKPGVVMIVLDDARVDDVRQMPITQRLLAGQGTTFTNAYAPFPQCCPARATILTGQYPHNHGVLGNKPPFGFDAFDDRHSLATYLDPDYLTSLNGKYFNGYVSETYVPPGWDQWRSPHARLYNTRHQALTVDGQPQDVRGYTPELQGRATVAAIREAAARDEPLFSYVALTVPHTGAPRDDVRGAPWVPKEWRDTYRGPLLPVSPAFRERDTSDKRRYVRRLDRLDAADVRQIREQTQRRRDSLMAVDQQVADVVAALRETGRLDDTYVVLVSDNGQLHGEHNMRGKLQPYQESVQVPLIIRGPGFEPGRRYDGVVGLQDLTPTILDGTGTELPAGAPEPDGVSLLDLVAAPRATPRTQLLEMTSSRRSERSGQKYTGPEGTRWYAQGVVSESGWKYVAYNLSGEEELFNLRRDPHELRDLTAGRVSPRVEQVLERMRRELDALEDCAGETCR